MLFQSSKKETLYIEEKAHITQSKLLMGYTMHGNYLSNHNNQYVLMNAILGGDSNSLLFDSLREHHGLCYSISSSYDESYGVLIVTAGVKTGYEQECISLIEKSIDELKKGDFKDQLFYSNQQRILGEIIGEQDNRYGMIRSLFNQHLNHLSPQLSSIESFQNISKKEIIQCSQELKLDTIFILRGNANE